MRKPYIPRLVLDLGDGDTVTVKSLMATQLEAIAKRTEGLVSNRAELLGQILAENPVAWRALVSVVRGQDYAATDVDLDVAEAWCVDDDGREVELLIEPQPCAYHRAGHEGIQDSCARCGQEAPAVGEDGNTVWVYADGSGVVPTRRERRSSNGLSPSPTYSSSSTPSDPGTETT